MRWIKIILGTFLIFTLIFAIGKTVLAIGYPVDVICPYNNCQKADGYAWNGGINAAGYYYSPTTQLYYPIGNGTPGSGSGPADAGGGCTGVYGSCTGYGACSTSCGPGTQTRTCYDTGCGTPQTQSQSCQVNDPNVWGPPTTCSVQCGTGTQNHTNQCGTTEAIACNTSACPAWTKLKDSSFISKNSLTDMLASAPVAYDSDDTTQQYFIVGADGVVVAPAISLDISNTSPTAKTGDPEYKVIYTPESYSMTPSSFLSYVKARKDFKVITDLGEITGSGIYVYNGDISISSNVTPFNQTYKVVLIATGTVTVSPAPDNTFSPVGTVSIVTPTINFDSNLTEAQGIFIFLPLRQIP